MDKMLKQALLYDFYGELLTAHQKSIYEDFVLNDFSLSEIGEDRQISRQGVYDIVKRCEKLLNSYEEKLHLVQKFLTAKEQVEKIHELAGEILRTEGVPKHPPNICGRLKIFPTGYWKRCDLQRSRGDA